MSASVLDRPAAPSNRRRSQVIALLFFTYFLTYLDRAIVASAIPFISKEFQLSSVESGAVLSAFFFSYAFMQIPSGLLVDKFGPTRLLIGAAVGFSIFTALTGIVQSLTMLLVVRILFGISEGPAPAAVSKTVALWSVPEKLGRSNGIVLSGTLLGSACAPAFVTAIVLNWGWREAFLSLLAPGLLLAFAIYWMLGRAPSAQLGRGRSASPSDGDTADTSWKVIFASRQMRWAFVAVILASCANWGLQNWLPTYLLKARGFSVKEMGFFASAPYAAGAVGYFLGGYVGDRYFASRRNVLILICLFLAALGTFGAAVSATGGQSVAFMTGAFLVLGMALSSLFTMPLILMPMGVAATAFGIVNTGAQISGFLSPILIGAVLDASNQNFAMALYFVVCALVASGIAASRIGVGVGSQSAAV